jgi:hypothetical protein
MKKTGDTSVLRYPAGILTLSWARSAAVGRRHSKSARCDQREPIVEYTLGLSHGMNRNKGEHSPTAAVTERG